MPAKPEGSHLLPEPAVFFTPEMEARLRRHAPFGADPTEWWRTVFLMDVARHVPRVLDRLFENVLPDYRLVGHPLCAPPARVVQDALSEWQAEHKLKVPNGHEDWIRDRAYRTLEYWAGLPPETLGLWASGAGDALSPADPPTLRWQGPDHGLWPEGAIDLTWSAPTGGPPPPRLATVTEAEEHVARVQREVAAARKAQLDEFNRNQQRKKVPDYFLCLALWQSGCLEQPKVAEHILKWDRETLRLVRSSLTPEERWLAWDVVMSRGEPRLRFEEATAYPHGLAVVISRGSDHALDRLMKRLPQMRVSEIDADKMKKGIARAAKRIRLQPRGRV